jgi:cholesterol 7-dehydrogenase
MLLTIIAVLSLGLVCYILFVPAKMVKKLPWVWIQEHGEVKRDNPPPYPMGWYRIMASTALKSGKIEKIECFNQDLLAFRENDGKVVVMNSTCPHLGANLADGKLANNCISCPFHGWTFNKHGKCVDVPYATKCEKIPAQATIQTWHVCEVNHSIYIWYSDSPTSTWQLPLIDTKLYSRYDGVAEHDVTCHVQEIAENGADVRHFPVVHGSFMIKSISWMFNHTWESTWASRGAPDTHLADMTVLTNFTLFGRVLRWTGIYVEIVQAGPANVYMHVKTPIGNVFMIQSVLPKKSNLQFVSEVVYSPQWFPRVISKIILFGFSSQFARDIPIWNNKKLLNRPLVIKSDGPILKFRRWMKQFYPRVIRVSDDD